ncbi:hypothetical protein MD484_g5044, partial [Candolleomyces efflorescens]
MDLATAPKLTEKGRGAARQIEEQTDDICLRLPRIVVRDVSTLPPYDFTPTLNSLAEWLAPVLGSLAPEQHEQFWGLFDNLLAVWEHIPHVIGGQRYPGDARREMLVKTINSRLGTYQAQGIVGKVVLPSGRYLKPWTRNLDLESYKKQFEYLMSQVSDKEWRQRDLQMQRRNRVRGHLKVIQMWRHFDELGDEPDMPNASAITCLNGSCTCIS